MLSHIRWKEDDLDKSKYIWSFVTRYFIIANQVMMATENLMTTTLPLETHKKIRTAGT